MATTRVSCRFLSRLFAWGIFAVATGCMHSESGDPNPYFSVMQERDIPAPRDFQFDKDRSFTYTPYRDPKGIGCFRTSTLYYYGDQQVGKLVPWYLDQMKADGWTHKDTRDEEDKRCLTFTKASETSTIFLYREYDLRFDKYLTKVQAEIHPTRTEEMASEDVLNPPAQGGRPERAELKGEGLEEPAESSELENDGPRSKADEGEAGIIQKTPVKGKSLETASPPEIPKIDPKRGTARNKQVVNEEVGGENNEESPEDSAPEDEGNGK